MRRALVLLALCWFLGSPLAAQPDFPELSGRVVDSADIIPEDVEQALIAKLENLEAETQRQLVVTTVPDLQGYDIADYGYQLGRTWGVGDAERDDGALLIVAPGDRKVRIEVGYGLEGTLTDAYASHIIQSEIIPHFRSGDMTGGIVAGTDALTAHLSLSGEDAIAAMQEQQKAKRQSTTNLKGFVLLGLLFMPAFFIGLIVIMAKMSGAFKTMPSRAGRGTSVSTYSSSSSSWSSGSSFSSSSFSGGGGSFGGGGASGSW